MCHCLSRSNVQLFFSSSILGIQSSRSDTSATTISELKGVLHKLMASSLSAPSSSSYSHSWVVLGNSVERYAITLNLPVKQHDIVLVYYIAYLFSEGYAASKITSYPSVFSYIHKLNNLIDPCASCLVQKLRVSARKLRPSQDVPLLITKSILYKICDVLIFTVSNVYEQTMFKSMFLLDFFEFLKIGKIFTVFNV